MQQRYMDETRNMMHVEFRLLALFASAISKYKWPGCYRTNCHSMKSATPATQMLPMGGTPQMLSREASNTKVAIAAVERRRETQLELALGAIRHERTPH